MDLEQGQFPYLIFSIFFFSFKANKQWLCSYEDLQTQGSHPKKATRKNIVGYVYPALHTLELFEQNVMLCFL